MNWKRNRICLSFRTRGKSKKKRKKPNFNKINSSKNWLKNLKWNKKWRWLMSKRKLDPKCKKKLLHKLQKISKQKNKWNYNKRRLRLKRIWMNRLRKNKVYLNLKKWLSLKKKRLNLMLSKKNSKRILLMNLSRSKKLRRPRFQSSLDPN